MIHVSSFFSFRKLSWSSLATPRNSDWLQIGCYLALFSRTVILKNKQKRKCKAKSDSTTSYWVMVAVKINKMSKCDQKVTFRHFRLVFSTVHYFPIFFLLFLITYYKDICCKNKIHSRVGCLGLEFYNYILQCYYDNDENGNKKSIYCFFLSNFMTVTGWRSIYSATNTNILLLRNIPIWNSLL